MDKEFLKWLEAERDEASYLSYGRYLSPRRRAFWSEHSNMLSAAVDEIKGAMYKEATGR